MNEWVNEWMHDTKLITLYKNKLKSSKIVLIYTITYCTACNMEQIEFENHAHKSDGHHTEKSIKVYSVMIWKFVHVHRKCPQNNTSINKCIT